MQYPGRPGADASLSAALSNPYFRAGFGLKQASSTTVMRGIDKKWG